MDTRDISRLNIKFGKFLDPFLLLGALIIVFTSIIAIKSLTPRTFTGEKMPSVLGVTEETEDEPFQLIGGNHNYITSEKLEEISSNHFKYTTVINKKDAGVISKPIIKIKDVKDFKAQLTYTNSTNSKVSLVDKTNNTSHLIKEKNNLYTPNIPLNDSSKEIFLLIEDDKSVFFKQYLEIHFFLNL